MDRVALAGWLVVGLVPALGWWAAHALSEQAVGHGDTAYRAEAVAALGAGCVAGLLLWRLSLKDGRSPPLPAPALAAVSPLHRGLARAAARALVVGLSCGLFTQAHWAAVGSTAGMSGHELGLLWAYMGAVAAGCVGAGALVEHAVVTATSARHLAVAAVVVLLACWLVVIAVNLQVMELTSGTSVWRGTSPGIDWGLALRWSGVRSLAIALLVATVTVARLRGHDVVGVALATGLAAPIIGLVTSILGDASGVSPGQSALEHLDVAVVLPLAVRAGDDVGPGWARP